MNRKQSVDTNTKTTATLELPDKHFKAALVKMLQQVIMHVLEQIKK